MQPEERSTPKLRATRQQNQLVARVPSGKVVALPRLNEGTTNLAKEVDREIGSLELSGKVRDLEVMMIDFKANVERRIQKQLEDNPQRFMQSFKQLEQQEIQLWKQTNDKQTIIQDQIGSIRMQSDKNRDQLTQMILELQKKQHDLEYKLQMVGSQFEGVEMKLQVKPNTPSQQPSGNLELELRLLREAFNTEKAHRDGIVNDLQRQQQELQQRLVKQDSEFFQRVKAQREEFLDQQDKTKQQIKGLDAIKIHKINTDQDYLKNLIGSVESRIADEVEKRLKGEFDQRSILENKMQQFKEEIRNDEKSILMNEQKFMKQMHDSVTSLNQIIKNTKEQLEANLAASQTIVTENIRSISKTVDMIKEATIAKVSLIEQGQRELNQRLGETRQMFHEHSILINNTLQKEFKKVNEEMQEYQATQQKSIEEQMKMINDERQLSEEWKKQFSNKNLVIFTEISNTFKGIKADLAKDRTESQDSIAMVKRELQSQFLKTNGFIQNLEEHVGRVQAENEFKSDQQKKELQDLIHNNKIESQTEIVTSFNIAVNSAAEYTQKQVVDAKQSLNERITKEMELAEEVNDNKLRQAVIGMKQHVEDREKLILQRLENLIDEEKEQRSKLQELVDQYGDMMKRIREQLEYEVAQLRQHIDSKVEQVIIQLQTEMKDKLAEQQRYLQQELLNMDLKMSNKLDALSAAIAKQIELLREYIQSVEKSIKSYVNQQLEEMRFELKAMIKEIENDLFRLRVWTLKQIEMMNQAMRELHIQIQSEMYMDRMYTMSIMEQYQEHLDQILTNQHRQNQEWQREMELTQQQLSDRLDLQFKQFTEKIEQDIVTLREQIEQQLNELYDKLHEELEQLENRTNEQFAQLRIEYNDKLQKLQDKLTNDLNELRKDTQNGLVDVCNFAQQMVQQLKQQIDQSHGYFEAKFRLEDTLRQGNDALAMERHAGVVGKLNLLVKELERLEEKKNKIKKDMHDFAQGTQNNFQILQKAIVAHGQFLNELDAKMSLEQLMQQTINDQQHGQLIGQIELLKEQAQGLNALNKDLEEKIENYNTTVHNQLEQIQLDQEEENQKTAEEIKATQEELKQQQKTLGEVKDQVDELSKDAEQMKEDIKEEQKQQIELVAQVQVIRSMSAAMEQNMVNHFKTQVEQCLGLIKSNNQLMTQNVKTVEKNFQVTLTQELGTIIEKQNQVSEQLDKLGNLTEVEDKVNDLMETNKKLIEDYEQLASDCARNFADAADQMTVMKQEIKTVKGEQGQAASNDINDINSNLTSYGMAIDDLKKEVKAELDKLQNQVDNLGQSAAQSQGGKQQAAVVGATAGEVTKAELNELKQQITKIDEQVKQYQKKVPSQNNSVGNNEEVGQLNDRISQLEQDLEAQFKEIDDKIAATQNVGPAKSQPTSKQIPDDKKSQQDIDRLQQDIKRIDQDIAKLKQQPVAAGAAKGKPQNEGEVEQLKQDMQRLEQDIGEEFQNMNAEIDKLRAAIPNKQDDNKNNNNKQQPSQDDVKVELARLDKLIQQMQEQIKSSGGSNKQQPAALNNDTQLLKQQITTLEKDIDDLRQDIDAIGEILEKNNLV